MELLRTLNIEPSAVLVNIVGFILLWIVCRKLVFIPIGKVLTERQTDITKTYDQLDNDRRQMEALKSDYEKRLAAIEAEAREKIQSAIKDAQAARDQIMTEANSRSREMITRAEEEVNREREQAMITLREQVVNLALGAATKVVGDSLDENRQRQLIANFINNPDASQDANFGTAPRKSGAGAVVGAAVAGAAVGAAAVAALAAAAAPEAPAKASRKSEEEDLSTLEALKPSAAKSAVRSGLRSTSRRTAESQANDAGTPSADAPGGTSTPPTEPQQ